VNSSCGYQGKKEFYSINTWFVHFKKKRYLNVYGHTRIKRSSWVRFLKKGCILITGSWCFLNLLFYSREILKTLALTFSLIGMVKKNQNLKPHGFARHCVACGIANIIHVICTRFYALIWQKDVVPSYSGGLYQKYFSRTL
jgi:hypothetical protein